jgi:hypothetical protein
MGEVFHGIPQRLALNLQQKYDLQIFVETGTLVGNTAIWAASKFEQVYTVEIALNLYQQARKRLNKLSNVELTYGESQDVLRDLVLKLESPALFWLDAHWSRDLGYPKFDAAICPVLEEIEFIGQAPDGHVVLVDDFRLFGEERGWPTKDQVKKALQDIGKSVTFSSDVFVAVPE